MKNLATKKALLSFYCGYLIRLDFKTLKEYQTSFWHQNKKHKAIIAKIWPRVLQEPLGYPVLIFFDPPSSYSFRIINTKMDFKANSAKEIIAALAKCFCKS